MYQHLYRSLPTLTLPVISLLVSTGSDPAPRIAAPLPPHASFAAILDTLAPAALRRSGAPGVTIAVVTKGRISLTRGYGLADRERGTPMTDTTRIGVASVSKLVSAWGALALAQQRRLALDAPVWKAVSGWTLAPGDFDRDAVTPRRLLSHTAGTSMLSVPCFPADSARPTEAAVLDGTAGDRGRVELLAQPGTRWRYSGGGYTLLQLALTGITARPFADAMRDLVLRPLHMTRSTFGAPTAGAATGYDESGKAVAPVHCVGEAAAGFVTTARDMALLLREYARARHGQSPILTPTSLRTMTEPLIATEFVVDGKPIDMGDTRMALGHFVHTTRAGTRMVFHSGGNPGTAAYVLVDLDHDDAIFVAVNSDNGRNVIVSIVSAWTTAHHTDPPVFF